MPADEQQLRAWMIGALDGDAADYASLLRTLAPLLRAFYSRRLPSGGNDIEDMVQETLTAVHTRRATYDRDRAFTAWLFAIARYKMIDHFRRSRRNVPLEGLEDLLIDEDSASDSQAQRDVDELLKTLPAKQANAIRATRLEGLSVAEAAAAGGIGESDVKVSVHRGLKALAARIRGAAR